MYAVIKTGGKQQKVKVGDVIEVEKIVHDGETMTFHPILVVDDDGKTHVGAEAAKAVVTAKPLGREEGRQGQDLQVPAEERVREARWSPPAPHDARDRGREVRRGAEARHQGEGRAEGRGVAESPRKRRSESGRLSRRADW